VLRVGRSLGRSSQLGRSLISIRKLVERDTTTQRH
jgi:hypothetical protein